MNSLKGHLVTADLHLGHKFVAHIRGFDTPKEHDDWLIERFLERMGENTTLWVLGDAAMNPNDLEPLTRLPGRKILVAGNHDLCWHRRAKTRDIRRAIRYIPQYSVFSEIYTSGQLLKSLNNNSQHIVFSHLPVSGDHQETDRYQNRRPLPGDLPLLCGHVHDAWRTKNAQLNVGVDVNNFLPLSLKDAILEAQSLVTSGTQGASKETVLKGDWNQFGLG